MVLSAQCTLGRFAIRRRPDDLNHPIDVVGGDQESVYDVLASLGLPQQVRGPAPDHVPAVREIGVDQLAQVQGARLALVNRQIDDRVSRLQWRVLEELIGDDRWVLAALEIHDQPHPVLAGVVLDVVNARDALIFDHLHHLGDDARLVSRLARLIGDLSED